MDRETSRYDCKNVGSDAKHKCKQTKSTQNNKSKRHASLNFAAVVCVYWHTGLSLVCYLENIRIIYGVNENILSNSVCLARFGVLALNSRKNSIT